VADLLVAARLRVSEAIDGEPAPERRTPQCGPARRVVTAQLDGEAVSARDLDRASAHIEGCDPCQAARLKLQEARLACRAWSAAPPSPVAAPSPLAAGRARLAAVVGGVALLLVLVVVVLGGGSESAPPAPAAPPVGQGSAEADGQDIVPPPGDEFCLPDDPTCP